MSDETRARIATAWPAMCAAVGAGEVIKDVLARHGISADMARAFRAGNPEAHEQWEDARRASADAFLDEALEVTRNRTSDPAHARVLVDTLKWAAAKRWPERYSERQQVDVTHKHFDMTRILAAANARLERQRAAITLPASAVRVLEPAPVVERAAPSASSDNAPQSRLARALQRAAASRRHAQALPAVRVLEPAPVVERAAPSSEDLLAQAALEYEPALRARERRTAEGARVAQEGGPAPTGAPSDLRDGGRVGGGGQDAGAEHRSGVVAAAAALENLL